MGNEYSPPSEYMMTYVQLQKENARLREAFGNLLEMVEQNADFSNGVLCPNGVIDEGRENAAYQLSKFREVLK